MNTQQFNLLVLEASSTNFPHKSLSLLTYANNICMKTEYFVLCNITFLINYEQSKSWPHLQNLIKTHIQQVRGMKWFVSYFYWILPTFGNIVNLEQRPTLKCFDSSRCSILYDFNILQFIALRMLPSSATILYLLVYYWTSSYWLGTGN